MQASAVFLVRQCLARTLFLLFVLACAWPGIAKPQSFLTETAWLEDSTGTWQLDDVRARAFERFEGVLAHGYTRGHLWLRLRIDPGEKQTANHSAFQQDLVVRLRPSFLDHVELYDPVLGSVPQISGDMYPWAQDRYRSLALNFVVPRGDQARDIYLMVRSTSSLLVYPEVLGLQEAIDSDQYIYLFSGLLTGLLLAFTLWSLIELLNEKDSVMLAFVVKQSVVFLHALAYLGYWRIWFSDLISPAALNQSFNLILFTMTASAIVFVYMLLREYQPSKWLMRLLLGSSLCLPAGMLLIAMGQTGLALLMISLLSLLIPLLTTAITLTVRTWHDKQRSDSPLMTRSQLIGFFVLLLVLLWIYAVQALGFVSLGADAIYGILSYNLVTSALMVYVLHARARYRQRLQVQQAERLASSERRAEREAMQRSDQRRFIDMLGHELTTLIATVRMNLSASTPQREAISQATSEMQGIVDRVVQAGRLDQKDFSTRPVPLDPYLVIQQVVELLQLNGEVQLSGQPGLRLKTDPLLLNAVINNLLDNARKYHRHGTLIDLQLQAHMHEGRHGALIRVANEPGAAGWPDAKQVFKKYYRNPRARRMSGSGLGLFLVHHMVEQMGGYIGYAPRETKVCFDLWLPLDIVP